MNIAIRPRNSRLAWLWIWGLATLAYGQPVIFSDATFNNADWTAALLQNSTAATSSYTAGQVASGGNPGEYRRVTHRLSEIIGVGHFSSQARYQGAIRSIDYVYDLINTSNPNPATTLPVAYWPALAQESAAGVSYYVSGPTDVIPEGAGWTRYRRSGLTAAKFGKVSGPGPANPDFSSGGGAIRFGYYTSNSNAGQQPIETISGIDNWSVTITPAPSCQSLQSLPARPGLFYDGSFSTGWTPNVFTTGSGGASSGVPQASGGNPGSFLRVDISIGPGSETRSTEVYAFYAKAGATYNPQTNGAIASLDYCEDFIFAGEGFGDGQLTGPALRQGGKVYVMPAGVTRLPANWTTLHRVNVTQGDFIELNAPGRFLDANSHPDFSAAGQPIEFGFLRANSSISGGYRTSIGIDNWLISVNIAGAAPPPPPPPPSGVSCTFTPQNTYLPIHRPEPHLEAPAEFPNHILTVSVISDGAPARAVEVSIAATTPVFASPSGALTQRTVTLRTDNNGQASVSYNPPLPLSYDQTDFTAKGTIGARSFECGGSVLTGLGAQSALLAGVPYREYADLLQAFDAPGGRPGPGPQGLPVVPSLASSRSSPSRPAPTGYGNLGLSFEANQGQTGGRIRYLARGPKYDLHVSAGELAVTDSSARTAPVRIRFAGPGASPRLRALEPLPARSHYLVGQDPKKWRLNVPHFARLKHTGVYPGVDLVFYGHQGQLRYDFVLAPGASPDAIRLRISGARRLELDDSGDLVLHHGAGTLRFEKPLVYQETGAARRTVACRYVLQPGNQVGFEVGAYDRARPLVIDPVLSYATFLGGGGGDASVAVAVDSQGNAYVTGSTVSTNFPTAGALQPGLAGLLPIKADAFVTKLNAAGTAIVYSTYIGGRGTDVGTGIAVDAGGNAYVTGSTTSPDFPAAQPIQAAYGGVRDAFVFKLNPTGGLVYSTYLGGALSDSGKSVAVDAGGNAHVAGYTVSTNFPVRNALQPQRGGGSGLNSDAFLAKVNSAGTALVHATYLGGAATDLANGVAADSAGNSYVTGTTYSDDFPARNPLQRARRGSGDAFVAKVNASGSALVYSTYLGGASDDFGTAIAVDPSGSAYVAGNTGSADFPLQKPAQARPGAANRLGLDAFITKLDAGGASLVYSTYLGGSGTDFALAIAVAPDGSVYAAGDTDSADLPAVQPIQSAAGLTDGFVAKLNPNGSSWASVTPLGGAGRDSVASIAVDSAGGVYLAGSSLSIDFPVTPGAYLTGLQGNSDGLVVKLIEGTPPPRLTAVSAAALQAGAALAPESIVSGFGQNLAARTEQAPGLPLPTTLAGISIRVRDNRGMEGLAPLFFASSGQINFMIPEGTANGPAALTVLRGEQVVAAGTVRIEAVAPSLFSANANGRGVAAALAVRVADGVAEAPRLVFQCGNAPGSCTAAPLEMGAEVYLTLFGTGIRGLSSAAGVTATLGGQSVPVVFVGPQGEWAGLDQVNLGPLPASLVGRGEVELVLTVDGKRANALTVAVR